MHERIALLIETLNIRRVDFARAIGVSQPFVSEMCSGAKAPSGRTISDICRVYGVSEIWLRTGNGEMFVPVSKGEELAIILRQIQFSDDVIIQSIIRAYWGLSETEKAAVRRMVNTLAEEIKNSRG